MVGSGLLPIKDKTKRGTLTTWSVQIFLIFYISLCISSVIMMAGSVMPIISFIIVIVVFIAFIKIAI